MAKRTDKTANRVKSLYDSLNNSFREKWEATNQQGYDFYLDSNFASVDNNGDDTRTPPSAHFNYFKG